MKLKKTPWQAYVNIPANPTTLIRDSLVVEPPLVAR